jgi:hypothetical protein
MNTVSGVSSIIRPTPAAFSKAVIFLHSLPISFHFISSLGISIIVVVTSLVTSQAYCWIDFSIISLASSFFLSSIPFLYFFITSTQSSENFSFISSKKSFLASSSDSFAISDILPSSSSFFSWRISLSSFSWSSFELSLSYFSCICSSFCSIFSSLSNIFSSIFSAFPMISVLSFFA